MYGQVWHGIILKLTNVGESDRIVTLYTKELGKVQCVARGARKMTTRYGGVVDLFVETRLEVTQKSHLPLITQVHTEQWFPYLRTSLPHWQYAERAAKALLRATSDEDPNVELYFLFQQFLVEAEHFSNPQPLWVFFLFKLLFLVGFGISTETCQSCRESLTVVAHKAPTYDGFVCTDCARSVNKDDQTVWEYLHQLSSRTTPLPQSELDTKVQQFLEDSFRYHLL